MSKRIGILFIFLVFQVCFITLWMEKLLNVGESYYKSNPIIISNGYKEQNIGEDMCKFLVNKEDVGTYVATYLLETDYGYEKKQIYSKDKLNELQKKHYNRQGWDTYLELTKAIWDDVQYFPVTEFTNSTSPEVSYVNSWMAERNYNGKGVHEGTDLIANKNESGLYPIVSMTDGVVTKKGWLEKGGYRIGITTDKGAYFYYAHLDSYANLEVGDQVKAGDLIGFMGDTGYGPEGTVGKFVVHLHLGIYLNIDGKEVAVNPYWVLRYVENKTVKCYTKE